MIGFSNTAQPRRPWQQRFPTYAEHGMLGAAHPLTVETGLAILRSGGNAVDAAVGAGLTAAVVMPEMCALGGDLFAVIHHPAMGTFSLQGSGISPRNSSLAQMQRARQEDGHYLPGTGPLSITVPGMVDAYFTLLSRFGTRSFADVAQYALAHARDGYFMHHEQARLTVAFAEKLSRDEAASAIFLPGDKPVPEGERFVQADLARTLETLGNEGVDAFYRGSIAKRITRYLQAKGGALAPDDFADHASVIGSPISTTYRDHTVYQTAIPSQGLILLEALNIAEHATLSEFWTADEIHVLTEAKKLAFADRSRHTGDPEFHTSPIATLLSKPWARKRFAEIDPVKAAATVDAGTLTAGDTTYLCAADGSGLMISLIQSVAANFGSCVVGGDTGVLLNNRANGFSLQDGHPNQYAPGKKTMHTLNAFLITDQQGRPTVVGGTPGGDGQPQWNLQAITGLIDGGLDVQAAIDLPRFSSWPGTDADSSPTPFELRVESRAGAEVIGRLRELGHTVVEQGPWEGAGAMQIISRHPDTGAMIGGSDPRVEGMILGF
jgi:gamma-glutamyltranspeptidase/glutathione hydrolase